MKRRTAGVDEVSAGDAGAAVERSLAQLFERLLLDIARMGAGEEVTMDYADPSVRRALSAAFVRTRGAGIVVDMQFSEPLALGIAYVREGEPTVWVEVEADEWTAYQSVADGWTRAQPCRQRRLVAEVDAGCSRILRLGRGA